VQRFYAQDEQRRDWEIAECIENYLVIKIKECL
jgi:hypothetical protein